MSALLDRAVARAVPPPERLDARRWRPAAAAETAATERRSDAWIAAFGGDAALERHLAATGRTRADWRRSLGDVEPAPGAALPDWAACGRHLVEALLAVEDAGGAERDGHAALRRLARTDLARVLPPDLAIADGALDGLLDLLASRLGAALAPSQQIETRLGGTPSWRTRLERSPVLLYLLGRLAADWLTASHEMLARAAADRDRIESSFFGGRRAGRLLAIDPGLGDPHDGGRSVAVLTFETGPVVYKPKDLGVVRTVDACARDLSAATGLALDVPGIELRGAYAWQEHVPVRPLAAAADAAPFWRNLGGWLGLLQAFDAIDFWFDNLLADGAVPRFIDFETALQPGTALPRAPAGSRPDAFGAFALSGLSVGILPWQFPIAEGVDPTDIGCLARPGEHRAPLSHGSPGDGGGHLTWSETRFAPRLPDGTFADAGAGRDDFLAGYASVLGALADEAVGRRLAAHLKATGAAPVRCIRIDTWTCFRLIRRSLLPRHLSDAVWREIALVGGVAEHADALPGSVADAAVADLRRLDVPLFACPADGIDLVAVDGARAAGTFAASPVEHARDRLVALAREPVESQVALARSAFAARIGASPAPASHRPADDRPADRDALLAACDAIGRTIADAAMAAPDGTPTWIGLTQDLFTGVAGIFPLGPDLVHGRAGIALALAVIGRATGRPELGDLARETAAGAARFLTANPAYLRRLGVGVAGAGGVIYAVGKCLGPAEARELVEPLAAIVHEHGLWRGQGDDMPAGRAGLAACLRAGCPDGSAALLVSAVEGATPSEVGLGRRYAPSALPVTSRIDGAAVNADPCPPGSSLAALDALWALESGAGADAAGRCARPFVGARAGAWFPDHPADDRHHLSAVTGLAALALALAAAAAGERATGPRRLVAAPRAADRPRSVIQPRR